MSETNLVSQTPDPRVQSADPKQPAALAPGGKSTGILTAEEWLKLPPDTDEKCVVIGSASQAIVRTLTKNLIEGPEKSFKTSFMLRLALGLSCGHTVYSKLPVIRARKILYLHGELSPREIHERTCSAHANLPRPLDNFFQGRDIQVHLIEPAGQARLKELIDQVKPDDLVLDPWQSLIIGFDENEYKDVSRACRFVDRLIEDYQLTTDIVTHTGKDRSRGTRGHSYLAGWRDTLIKLERRPAGAGTVLVNVEPRWAAPPEPFTLMFDQGTLIEAGFNVSPFTKQAQAIRDLVNANGGQSTREAVGQALGLSGDALRQALKRASDSGAIKLIDEDVTL